MFVNRNYKLTEDVSPYTGINLKKGQELGILMNVVYLNGLPLPRELQSTFLDWISKNLNKLTQI